MTFSESLHARVRDALARRNGVEERKMLGGVAFFLNRNLLVGVWKDSLIVQVGPENGGNVRQKPHVEVVDITGWPINNGIQIEPKDIEDDEQLEGLIERAWKFVETLDEIPSWWTMPPA